MDLTYDVHQSEGWHVISVRGEIDVYSAPTLREPLNELVDQPGISVMLDLENVDFLDSMGLRVIVGAQKRTTATGGRFAIICTKAPILNVLHITGLDQVIPIHDLLPISAAGLSAVLPANGQDRCA